MSARTERRARRAFAARLRRSVRRSVSVMCAVPLALAAASAGAQAPSHPLEPLTAQEIATTTELLRAAGRTDSTSAFVSITLREPPKAEVAAFHPGDAMVRRAKAIIYQRGARRAVEAVVDLTHRQVQSWRVIPGAQAPFLPSDYALMQQIVRADSAWQRAMHRRGITALDSVQIDPWSAGVFDLPGERGKRIWRALSYYKGSAQNAYARPIEGVIAYVDMDARRVMRLVDTGVVPVRHDPDDYDLRTAAARDGGLREALPPLRITQPEGAGFHLEEHEVRWQGWHFRFAVKPREGLVLYTVGFEDHGRVRPILYRASLSEMVVPYGDPGPGWFFRNAFDAGEYGLWGFLGAPLDASVDAPPNATFIDAVLADEQGQPVVFPRAAAIYERDGGTLWKHVADSAEGRRARELVLELVTTVGNYEYGFHWIFHQDGVLEQDVELTGILQPKGVRDSTYADAAHDPAVRHATLVAPGLAATYHQHFFNFRLDFDVDGPANRVVEMNVVPTPRGQSNPYGNGFATTETVLAHELAARRTLNAESARTWRVESTTATNALGGPTAYMLMPGSSAVPYADSTSSVRRRAGFLDANLWVTAFAPDEMHAAGEYVNQNPGGDGLVKWTRADRPLEGRDVVVWYTMGMTHIPRPEEWPMMSVQHLGFRLMPAGFFDRDPALDVPPPAP
ncbi:MAG TPA: primary-amine oxidase [Gemmatimonadaceae bacterium]|nr:primary-amine oxidase [Gemmatimonadaceae bacterium]